MKMATFEGKFSKLSAVAIQFKTTQAPLLTNCWQWGRLQVIGHL